MNSRDMGHLIANNEATLLDCGWFPNKALGSFPGETRRLIDPVNYPPVDGMPGGTAGGVPNDEPILGHYRYYYDEYGAMAAWVRIHGNVVEYWPTGGNQWIQIGDANWPNGCVPDAEQFQNTMIIMHGTLDTYYMAKFLIYNGTSWLAGDVPVPGFYTLTPAVFTGGGVDDMTAWGNFTGSVNRFFVVEIERNTMGWVYFQGVGLNDIAVAGPYTGADERTYIVRISAVAPDMFEWSQDGGNQWSIPINITGAVQILSDGVTITFAAVVGHTVGNYWSFYCGPTDAIRWSMDAGATWEDDNIPITAGVAIGLTENINVIFLADVGHTVTDYWEFDVIVNGLPNLRPAFAVAYKNRLFAVSPNEPYRLRFSAVRNPRNFLSPDGGYVGIGEEAGDPIKGLWVHDGRIYIFKKHSNWIYWIDDYGIQHIYQHRSTGGLLNHRCIAAMDDIIYYITDRGIYMLYGADYDCVSDKVHPNITAHPDYLKYAQLIVHQPSCTIWATYLVNIEYVPVSESDGETTVNIYHSHTWVGQIRRGLKTNPRWTRLPYHRITGYAMPPKCNNYRGADGQKLRFDAQQPDVTQWNTTNRYPDALYPTPAQGGPRHYSYRWNTGYDKDVVPAITGYYAGDHGVGWYLNWRSRRFMPVPTTRNLVFDRARLEYNVWKNQVGVGIDVAWGQVRIDEWMLKPSNPDPSGDTHFPIGNATTYDPVAGGHCFEEWSLAECRRDVDDNPGAYGKTIMLEFNCCGTANRNRDSWRIEFKDFGIELDMPEAQATTDRGI